MALKDIIAGIEKQAGNGRRETADGERETVNGKRVAGNGHLEPDPGQQAVAENGTADPGDDKLKAFYQRLRDGNALRGLPDDYGRFQQALSDTSTRRAFYERARQAPSIKGLPDRYEQFNSLWGAEDEKGITGNGKPTPTRKQDTPPAEEATLVDLTDRERIGNLSRYITDISDTITDLDADTKQELFKSLGKSGFTETRSNVGFISKFSPTSEVFTGNRMDLVRAINETPPARERAMERVSGTDYGDIDATRVNENLQEFERIRNAQQRLEERGNTIKTLQSQIKTTRERAEELRSEAVKQGQPTINTKTGSLFRQQKVVDPDKFDLAQDLEREADKMQDKLAGLEEEQLYATGSPEDRVEMDEGTLRKTVEEFAKGAGRGLVNLPKALATLASYNMGNPAQALQAKQIQMALQKVNESETLASDREFQNESLGNVYDNPAKLIPYLSGKIGESFPTMLPGLGAAKLLTGAGKAAQIAGAALASSPIETAAQLEDLEQTAASENRNPTTGEKWLAVASGMLSATGEGFADAGLMRTILKGLNKTGLDDAAKEAAKKEIAEGIADIAVRVGKAGGKGFSIEGATEGVQQVIANTGAKFGWDPDRGYFEGVPESMVVGGLTGASITGIGTGITESINKRRYEAAVEQAKRQRLKIPFKSGVTQQEEQAQQEAERRRLNVPYGAGSGPEQQGLDTDADGEGAGQARTVQPEIEFSYDPEAAGDVQLQQLSQEERRLSDERARVADAGQEDLVKQYEQALDDIARIKAEVESEQSAGGQPEGEVDAGRAEQAVQGRDLQQKESANEALDINNYNPTRQEKLAALNEKDQEFIKLLEKKESDKSRVERYIDRKLRNTYEGRTMLDRRKASEAFQKAETPTDRVAARIAFIEGVDLEGTSSNIRREAPNLDDGELKPEAGAVAKVGTYYDIFREEVDRATRLSENNTREEQAPAALAEPINVSDGRYRVENDPDSDNASQVRLVDTETGKPLSRSSRNFNPAFAEFLTGEQMQGLPRVDEQQATEAGQEAGITLPASQSSSQGDITLEDYLDTVASESGNPMELIEAYEDALILKEQVDNSETGQVFEAENYKLLPDDVARVMGSDYLPENRILYTQTSKSGTPLDVQAEIYSDRLGREVSEQEIIEYRLDALRRSNKFNKLRDTIKERFKDVTGVGLTESLVNAVQQRQVQEFLEDDGSIMPDVQGLIDNYIDETGRIDYTGLWQQELQDDSGKSFFTGFPGDLTEEQYQRLKNEVEQKAKNEQQEGRVTRKGEQARREPGAAAEAGSTETADGPGTAQVSDESQQQADREQQRIDTILAGQDVGPIEEDTILGDDLAADNTIQEKGKLYGETKQYTEARGPDGQPIGYVSTVQEARNAGASRQGELPFGPAGPSEDTAAAPGGLTEEFWNVKRGYRPDNNWKFTGAPTLNNTDDVAYLMRELETAATEQGFIVGVNESGESEILHIGSGLPAASLVDISAMQAMIEDFKPTTIYFVHNHPSGKLEYSRADMRLIKQMASIYDGKLHGIIMDAYKGEYAVFYDDGDTFTRSRPKASKDDPESETAYPVRRFDKAVYAEDMQISEMLTSPQAVARYLTGTRYSVGDKTIGLLLANDKRINAVISITAAGPEAMGAQLKAAMPRYNASAVVLAGRGGNVDTEFLTKVQQTMGLGELSDYIQVDASFGNTGNYKSLRSRGLIREDQAGYVSEPGTSFERQQLERQFEQAKKEYQAARTAFSNKQRELEGRLADDRQNLFGERATDSSTSMFDMRADPAQVEKTLQPFRDRREVAKQQVNRLAKKLEQLSDRREPDLFDAAASGPSGVAREAELPSNFKPFKETIKKYWDGSISPYTILNLGSPSAKLKRFGLPDLPITISQRVLKKGQSDLHYVSDAIINDLPSIINNPMMSLKKGGADNFTIISNVLTGEGRPVLTGFEVRADKGGIKVNDIRTFFGKRTDTLLQLINEGRLEKVDKKEALRWIGVLSGTNYRNTAYTQGLVEKVRRIIENSNDVDTPPSSDASGGRLRDAGAAYSADMGEPGSNPQQDAGAGTQDADSSPIMVTDANGVQREVQLGHLDKIHGMAMPELVRMVHELTGQVPGISTRFRSSRGKFYPVEGGKIGLSADVFQDTKTATKVLAHEIGHLVDYLPDETMSRGNLLGRLKSLRRFLKTTAEGSESTGPGLTKKDRQRIRSEATKAVIAEEGITLSEYIENKDIRRNLTKRISARYKEYIAQEIRDRKLLSQEGLFNELYKHSKDWRPFDENAVPDSYRRYRRSSEELYADALSALLTSPGTLERNAPTFYNEFFAQLEEKPKVKSVYLETQAYLNGGNDAVQALRNETIEAAYQKAEAKTKQLIEEREKAGQSYVSEMRQSLEDKWHPIIKKLDEAEKAGKTMPVNEDPRYLLQELDYADNASTIYLYDVGQQVVNPIEDAGMSTLDLHKYLLFNRIANEGVASVAEVEGDLTENEQDFMERSDAELDEQRKQYGRAFMANPGGLTAETAQEQLDYMQDQMPAEKFEVLEQAARRFQELNFAQVEEAVEAGTYSREIFEKLIKPNKYNYATFRVIDYIEYPDYVNAAVKAGKGTFKEVGSTFDATLLKTLSLVQLNQQQRAKLSFRNTWQDMFPEEISKAEQISPGRFRTPPDKGAIEMLEDGKKVVYNVDPYIAQAFEFVPKETFNWFVRFTRWTNESIYRPLFITYNPAFTFWSNPNRDFKRMYRNLPEASLRDAIKAYIDSWQDAKDYSKGNMDNPRIRRLVDEFAIAPPGEGLIFKERGDALGRQMERFHLLDGEKNWVQKQTEKYKALQWWPKMLSWIRTKGSVIEILPKLAADKILTAEDVSAKERAYKIRNYFGTPNFKKGGRSKQTTNAIYMFSNIMIQGYTADAEVATDPKSRGAFWMRTAMLDILPKLLIRGAVLGWFGDELKEFYDKATEYDKTNYVNVPLGWQQGGSTGRKPVYLRMPQDESARLVSSMIWKLTGVMADDPENDLNQVFDLGADEIPGVAPFWQSIGKWGQFLSGKNPQDDWRDRGILPQRVQDARKVTEGPAIKKMVEWTINQTGLTSIATYNPNANNTTEFIMQTAPILNRMIKSTDYGALESQNALEDLENARKQAIRLEYGEDVLRMVSRTYYLSRLGDKRIGNQPMEYEYLNNFYQQVYKPMDELIRMEMEKGNEESADELIKELQDYGAMYEDMVDEVKERPKAEAKAAAE